MRLKPGRSHSESRHAAPSTAQTPLWVRFDHNRCFVEATCADALAARLRSADALLDPLALGREPEPPPPVLTPASLTLGLLPEADCARHDSLRPRATA